MRMMTAAHNSNGSLRTIWIGGLTPLEGNNPLALTYHHDNAVMLFEPFNVPETNVGQLWMADECEKGYLNCITDLSP
ncbi:hypothetical protein AAG906_021196 [Vitis piasezkii]